MRIRSTVRLGFCLCYLVNFCTRSSKSFREEQCASYNNVLYERKYYDWIPYLKVGTYLPTAGTVQ
jgi:hypothetical protein